jgi:sigma-B regulation protein RsbU (phosphoserine phosphatase)
MLGFLIADVCGKGVPAAIFMAMSRTILQFVAVMAISPADCLNEANYMLATQNAMGLFVTVFYGLLNTNNGELLFANAGHNSPLLRKADARIRELENVRGVVLGIEEQFEDYEQGVWQLEAGDTLLLTTDGVDEAKKP